MGRFCRIGDARAGSGSPCDAADGATGHNQAHSEKLEKFNGRNEVVPVVCAAANDAEDQSRQQSSNPLRGCHVTPRG
jgi:hypothetical protein